MMTMVVNEVNLLSWLQCPLVQLRCMFVFFGEGNKIKEKRKIPGLDETRTHGLWDTSVAVYPTELSSQLGAGHDQPLRG